ncbi:MAG: o-succinylbenzoate synthase [Muribaculaceae bacterium]|nr:o-succinylbenzoate synthase [Muribaculaceae bacterium]
MLRAESRPITLRFKETAITSRASMTVKESYVVKVWDDSNPQHAGYGEAALFKGLSAEDTPGFEALLAEACAHPDRLPEASSIRFGFEGALADLRNGGSGLLADTPFTRGEEAVTINGLIWMGTKERMKERIRAKLDAGFRCVKLKIGGIRFEDELELLQAMRREFSRSDLELRVDANGAFTVAEAPERLARLAALDLHSIEQPIKAGQPEAMAKLCATTPLPIALDEELIGFRSDEEKRRLLAEVRPQYIILKPSLCGGFREADAWIAEAERLGTGWWATSALESNIGLSAIAQWVSRYPVGDMPQGLGTGALYQSNFKSPLRLEGDRMTFDRSALPSDASLWF